VRRTKLGLVLPLLEAPATGHKRDWDSIRRIAQRAEELGFETVWIPDELLWRVDDWPGPRGWWECVAMAGAVAASTSRVEVGTWVLSALHRNPGLTAKIAETLDEISAGRILLGLGSGHAGKQGKAFGYPADHTIGRFEEALQIIVPLLREGRADFAGQYHRAVDLEQRPRGPRTGSIPLMLGGHRERTMGLAVRYADIWSAYATDSSLPETFKPMLSQLDATCAAQGRDPASLGRSIGVFVEPTDDHTAEASGLGIPISGSHEEIANTQQSFGALGVTRLEIMLWPNILAALEAFAPVLPMLDGTEDT
jgi:alkanesulfonate monooxygenase SsuD/methylene tetrahydromethanopterin reductase-like flavin-dependent oxidoreductase (luciferase family)